MQIKERIDSCLSSIETKRQSVDQFQARLRMLIESLKSDGMKPGTLTSLLQTLEEVLGDYAAISASCHEMIQGLRDIGAHMDHIEDGRQKILSGVESILENLTHLDSLARNGMQVGAATGKKPKRILLVRISPDGPAPSMKEEDDDEGPAGDTVIH